jgi:hypothetical protein
MKEAFDGQRRVDEKLALTHQNSQTFIDLNPAFVDSKANGEKMNAALKSLYGELPRAFTVEEFETAYNVLRAANSLELNQAEIKRQEKAAAEERAKEVRARRASETRVYSEDEKYSMSLDELKEAENREIQRRMQKIGNEGGYY